jgi:hypothetical protein
LSLPPPSQVPCKYLLQRTELVDEAFQASADHAAQAQVLGAHVRKHELSHVGVVEDFAQVITRTRLHGRRVRGGLFPALGGEDADGH